MTQTFSATAIASLSVLTQAVEAAEGFPALVAALRAGRSGTIDGAWGSSAALAAASLGRHIPGILLVVLAHAGDLDSWAEDLAGFAGAGVCDGSHRLGLPIPIDPALCGSELCAQAIVACIPGFGLTNALRLHISDT